MRQYSDVLVQVAVQNLVMRDCNFFTYTLRSCSVDSCIDTSVISIDKYT